MNCRTRLSELAALGGRPTTTTPYETCVVAHIPAVRYCGRLWGKSRPRELSVLGYCGSIYGISFRRAALGRRKSAKDRDLVGVHAQRLSCNTSRAFSYPPRESPCRAPERARPAGACVR